MHHQVNTKILRPLHTAYLCDQYGSQPTHQLFPYTALNEWLLSAFAKLRKATISIVMWVCPSAWYKWVTNGQIFIKFHICVFCEILSRKFKLHKNLRRITGNVLEDPTAFLIISRVILRRIKYVSDRTFGENQNACLKFNNLFSRKSCPFWDNVEKYGSAGQTTTDNTAHAYCMMDT